MSISQWATLTVENGEVVGLQTDDTPWVNAWITQTVIYIDDDGDGVYQGA